MKRLFVWGTAVLALSTAPLFAQSGSTRGRDRQPGAGSPTDQAGSRPGPRPAPGTGSQTGSEQGPLGSDTASPTGSQTGAGPDAQHATTKASTIADHHFVMDAARGSMAEIELGMLASMKASNAKVKQFGERMVADHTNAHTELKALAQSKNITLPRTIDAKHRAAHDRLGNLSGDAFDRAYMQEMVIAHRTMLDMFRKESQSGNDREVKAWATKMMPTIQEHLAMARSSNSGAVGTSGRGAPTRGAGGSSRARGAAGSAGSGGSSTGANQNNPR
jgi:putative membrane protein